MRGQIHDLRDVPDWQTLRTVEPAGVDGDVIHPSLERVLVAHRADYKIRQQRVVPEKDVEPLLLAREQGGVEIAKIFASLRRMLDRVQNETVLQTDRIFRITLATFEQVATRFRQDPEVIDARAGMLLALCADLAVVERHLPVRCP